jgi:hypothetical protein
MTVNKNLSSGIIITGYNERVRDKWRYYAGIPNNFVSQVFGFDAVSGARYNGTYILGIDYEE